MKRLILTILCLLICSPALAQEQLARMSAPMLGAGVSAAAPGYVLKDSSAGAGGSTKALNAEARQWTSGAWIPGSTYGIRRVILKLKKYNTPTMDATLEIYATTGTAGEPTTSTVASTTTIAAASLAAATDCTEFTFDFDAGTTLNSGTIYAFVIKQSAWNATHSIYICYDALTGKHLYSSADDPVSFGLLEANSQPYFKTYTYE